MKFTIADKEEAQLILENNSSLSQEDKEIVNSKPVFSVLKTFFWEYYNLELLHPTESNIRTDGEWIHIEDLKKKPIAKYWPNYDEYYVSMVPSRDFNFFRHRNIRD